MTKTEKTEKTKTEKTKTEKTEKTKTETPTRPVGTQNLEQAQIQLAQAEAEKNLICSGTKNRFGHGEGTSGGLIDRMLERGATMAEMVEAVSACRHQNLTEKNMTLAAAIAAAKCRVSAHLGHMPKAHGKGITKSPEGIYRFR